MQTLCVCLFACSAQGLDTHRRANAIHHTPYAIGPSRKCIAVLIPHLPVQKAHKGVPTALDVYPQVFMCTHGPSCVPTGLGDGCNGPPIRISIATPSSMSNIPAT